MIDNPESLPTTGRLLAVVELLQAGHSPAEVAKALTLIDQGDTDGALKLLLPLKTNGVS